MWFSVIYQQESATGTSMAPPSGPPSDFTPHPTLQPVTEPLFEFPESYSKFPLAICFAHGIVNFWVTLSIHLPFSLLSSPCVHMMYTCLFFFYFTVYPGDLSMSEYRAAAKCISVRPISRSIIAGSKRTYPFATLMVNSESHSVMSHSLRSHGW